MPLQDVSNDQAMINWLHQSGHGHLIDSRPQNSSYPSPPALPTQLGNYPPPSNEPLHQTAPFSNPHFASSLNHPSAVSPSPPIISGLNLQPQSQPQHQAMPPYPHPHQPSPELFHSSASPFAPANINDRALDVDIEVRPVYFLPLPFIDRLVEYAS
jgi:hypothetical protein